MQGDLLEELYRQYYGGAVGLVVGDSMREYAGQGMVHLHCGGNSLPLADRKFL